MVKLNKNFKLGIKFYHPYQFHEFLSPYLDLVDFVEIMALPENDYSFFKYVNKPCILHNAHSGQGFNLSDISKIKRNFECLDFSLNLAKDLDAKYVIVHPGQTNSFIKTEFELMLSQLLDFKKNYERGSDLIVENLMKFCSVTRAFTKGFNFETMQEILKETNLGFCYDFAHASVTQLQLKKPLFPALSEYFKLNPVHYHASDLLQKYPRDQHLHFGDGNLPYKQIIPLIPDGSWITLETDIRNSNKLCEDIAFFRDF